MGTAEPVHRTRRACPSAPGCPAQIRRARQPRYTSASTDPSCASSALSPLAKCCDLVAVTARGHVAPPPMVRPRAVIKPKNTLLILTAPYEAKFTSGEQFGGTFS